MATVMEPWEHCGLLRRRGRKAIGLECPRPPFKLTEKQEHRMAEEEAYWEWYDHYEGMASYGEDEA